MKLLLQCLKFRPRLRPDFAARNQFGFQFAPALAQRLRLLLVDAVVRPFADRGEVLGAVFDLARYASPETPTIVMGDFNTQVDSAWFEGARRDFVHVFEEAGHGLLATWPVPMPVLALDHVWVSRSTRVACARIGWSWASDHRPVSARISLEP